MPFAIKFIQKTIDEYGLKTLTDTRYYSQTIEKLLPNGFEKLILLCDGKDPDEVDVSDTLIDAEKKASQILPMISNRIRPGKPFVSVKIVEYPEYAHND
jgi:hypothetical protein